LVLKPNRLALAMVGDRKNKPIRYKDAVAGFEDGVARIAELYGLSPLVGRLYAALFLSPDPMSLDALCRRVGAAKSTVSVALRKLTGARVVRRLPGRGDRRDYFEAVTDPWAALADWNRLFFRPELDMWRETSGAIQRALGSAKDAPSGREKAEVRRRLGELTDFAGVLDEMLGGLRKTGRDRPKARAIPIRVEPSSEPDDEA
jgi:DNA-binding transcriptional regulator GbsR (MarR family)